MTFLNSEYEIIQRLNLINRKTKYYYWCFTFKSVFDRFQYNLKRLVTFFTRVHKNTKRSAKQVFDKLGKDFTAINRKSDKKVS